MNVLITGANGQLGNALRLAVNELAAADCSAAGHFAATPNFLFSDIAEPSAESIAMLQRLGGDGVYFLTLPLDITDLADVRRVVRTQGVDVIVNCAAFTNVDAAESQPELAEQLNAKAPENLALVMKETGGLLVHISTDYVFGAETYNTPCREDQTGTPTGVYGLTKLHGEQAIRRVGCKHVILRTAWLYSEFGKNFVRTMLQLTASRPQLKVVFDQCGTPTYAGDLAGAIVGILEDYRQEMADQVGHDRNVMPGHAPVMPDSSSVMPDNASVMPGNDRASYSRSGTYHYSNEGVCSWYDFAKTIAEIAGNNACDIQPCHSYEFPSPVRRPAYSVLDKTRIKETFGLSVPYWTDSLRKCLANLI